MAGTDLLPNFFSAIVVAALFVGFVGLVVVVVVAAAVVKVAVIVAPGAVVVAVATASLGRGGVAGGVAGGVVAGGVDGGVAVVELRLCSHSTLHGQIIKKKVKSASNIYIIFLSVCIIFFFIKKHLLCVVVVEFCSIWLYCSVV